MEHHVAPLLWRKKHGNRRSLTPDFTRFGEEDDDQDPNGKANLSTAYLSGDFWYSDQFKERMYKRDVSSKIDKSEGYPVLLFICQRISIYFKTPNKQDSFFFTL